MSGRDLEQRFKRLSIPLSKLHRASGISPKTILKAFAGDPKTRDSTKTQLHVTLERLEQEQETQARAG